MTKSASIEQFYKDTSQLIPEPLQKEVGHFNLFRTDDFYRMASKNRTMPFNRRAYYKISLILGRNRAEYADKVIDIEHNALLFATPLIPYNYVPQDENQSGFFWHIFGRFPNAG